MRYIYRYNDDSEITVEVRTKRVPELPNQIVTKRQLPYASKRLYNARTNAVHLYDFVHKEGSETEGDFTLREIINL